MTDPAIQRRIRDNLLQAVAESNGLPPPLRFNQVHFHPAELFVDEGASIIALARQLRSKRVSSLMDLSGRFPQ